jgi:hypothetical protein
MEKNRYALHLITLEFTGKSPQILMKLIEIVGKSIQYRVSPQVLHVKPTLSILYCKQILDLWFPRKIHKRHTYTIYAECRHTCKPCNSEIPALRFSRKDPVNPCKHF